MSNLTVQRLGAEAQRDNEADYANDYAATSREFKPRHRQPLDWRAYAVIVAGILAAYLVLFIVYSLWKLIYCWNPIRAAKCATINDIEPTIVLFLILAPFILLIADHLARIATRTRYENAYAARTNMVLDRYGNPLPADLYNKVDPAILLALLVNQYNRTQAMEQSIAEFKQLPRGLESFSPSNTRHEAPPMLDEPQDEANDPLALLPSGGDGDPIVKFLLQRGLINRSGNSLLIGFSAPDKPHYIELDETGLIALAGQPRVGKSVTAQFIAAQVALIDGAELIICDKHGKKDKGLLNKLDPIAHTFARCAITQDEIINAIDYWYEVGANRLIEDSTRQYPPCFIIIDEFTALILLEWLPATTLHKLISGGIEYPGVQCHGMIIGHSWTGKMLGALGTTTRRATTQRLIHRIDPQDAELLIDRKFAKQTLSLPDGALIFAGASQPIPIEVRVPHIDRRDLEHIARLLPAAPAAQIGPFSVPVAGVAGVSSALQSAETIDAASDPPDAENVDPADFTNDDRTRVAADLLGKRDVNGWRYTYRQVQQITNLRTATIVAVANAIGRKRER